MLAHGLPSQLFSLRWCLGELGELTGPMTLGKGFPAMAQSLGGPVGADWSPW